MTLQFTSWAMVHAPTISVVLKLHAFLLELESRFLKLLVPGL